ncbi:MAG: hypothetical protein ACKOW8_04080, partial [Flavobacteriales bacterium]
MRQRLLLALFSLLFIVKGYSQGLQGIIVERYYQTDAADEQNAIDQGPSEVPLTVGTTVYRLYVDMADGYKFSTLFGTAAHPLTVNATANFFNDPNYGVTVDPGIISAVNIRKHTAMIDSWFTTGSTSNGKVGVIESEDTDGTVGNQHNVLANNPGGCFNLPLNGTDGRDGQIPSVDGTYASPNLLGLGNSLDALQNTVGNSILITDGAIAALGGIVGPTSTNRILLAQFAVNGDITFNLNVQLVNIATGAAENYVASNPVTGELTHPSLIQTITPACGGAGCTDPTACNFDPLAPSTDNTLCVYPGCTTDSTACNYDPTAGCPATCESAGCMDVTACNYDSLANCEDGSCTFQGCLIAGACNFDNNAGCGDISLCIFPDSCTNPFACNYDSTALCDNGSCLLPGCSDASACNYDSLAACAAECFFPGCTNEAANNYNPEAGCGEDSIYCTFDGLPGCTDSLACNYDSAAEVNDGSCILAGCINSLACNFDSLAGCDNGSCILPGCSDNTACNFDTTGLCSNLLFCLYPGCSDDPTACNYDPAPLCSEPCTFPGCMVPNACNYDSTAGCEDVCYYPGCTDPLACNYFEVAECDDSSCVYGGCGDETACNYILQGCDDASCIYQVVDSIVLFADSAALLAGFAWNDTVFFAPGIYEVLIDGGAACDSLYIVTLTSTGISEIN